MANIVSNIAKGRVVEGDVVVDAIIPVTGTTRVQYVLSVGRRGGCKVVLRVTTNAGEVHEVAAKIKIKAV